MISQNINHYTPINPLLFNTSDSGNILKFSNLIEFGTNPINFIDPFGLCSESTEKVTITAYELLGMAGVESRIGNDGSTLKVGVSDVLFVNNATGEKSLETYYVTSNESSGFIAGVGIESTVTVYTREVDSDTTMEEAAESFTGPFKTSGGSLLVLNSGYTTGQNEGGEFEISDDVWGGWTAGANLSLSSPVNIGDSITVYELAK